MLSWQSTLVIGSGGFLGAVLRAYLNGVLNKTFVHDIPFGTLGVNLLGSFLFGVVFALIETGALSPHLKSFLLTGVLGAFTTYSTFAFESFLLLNSQPLLALSNIALNVAGTIFFAAAGYKIFS